MRLSERQNWEKCSGVLKTSVQDLSDEYHSLIESSRATSDMRGFDRPKSSVSSSLLLPICLMGGSMVSASTWCSSTESETETVVKPVYRFVSHSSFLASSLRLSGKSSPF